MAPRNVPIRSDSWLNLSDCVNVEPARRSQQESERIRTRDGLRNYLPDKRHSICTSYLDQSLLVEHSTGDQQQQEQHLLIRVKQRSYFNSRCLSSGSLSSNLSASIELNASESYLSQSTEPTKFPLLKRQPLKLTTLRESLKTTSSNSKHHQGPLVRSFSSLSERLGSKLSNFKCSWKQLLHDHRKDYTENTSSINDKPTSRTCSITDESNRLQPEEVPQVLKSAPLSTLYKRQLTNQWVRRHLQRLLQQANVDSLIESNRALESNNRTDANRAKSTRFTRAKSLDIYSSSSSSNTSSHLEVIEAPSKQNRRLVAREQVVAATDQFHRKDPRADTRSSSTLVSRSSSSASTLDSRLPKNQHYHQQVTPQHTSTHKTTMTQPTSDYWSSSTTNTDYGAGEARRTQQVPQQMRRLPTLAPDADYYMQVAELERQRCVALSLLDEEEEDADFEDYAEPADESCLLDRSQVELVQMIGEGQKGYVFLGKLQSRDGRLVQDVAIKTLKYETEHLIEKLMREAHLMRQLEHPHIIRFIGVCLDTPALIAMELAELGEIKQYLKLNEHIIPASHLVLFTFQISTALSYLESRQCVHRDVAARNVLVCSHNCVKLADFDLSRDLQPTSGAQLPITHQLDGRLIMSPASPNFGHYVATAQGKLPIRWLAPESLTMRRFTSASDVWMFAVCAWELFHYGSMRPWHSIRNNQVLLAIESGQRLTRPPSCPERLYQLMLRCWAYSPDDRPRFKDIKLNLWSIYLQERALVQLNIEQRQQEKQQQHSLMQSRFVPTPNQSFIDDQADFRQQPRTSSHHLPYSYSSNASGYSSNNPVDHSTNSSRSSTMGSMIRNKAQVSTSQQQVESKVPSRYHKIPGHMLERQRSHGSIVNHAAAMSEEKLAFRTRDDQILSQVNKHYQQSRPISEMYIDTRRAPEGHSFGFVSPPKQTTRGSESRTRVRADGSNLRPSSTCCDRLTVLESSPRRETTYDGVNPKEAIATQTPSRRCLDHHSKSVPLPLHQQTNSNLYSQDQSTNINLDQYQPNANLTPNSLEEQRQLVIHQRLLGQIRQPKLENNQQSRRRSTNMGAELLHPTGGSATTDTVDQSLEILESLIAGRNFSKRSAVVKNITSLNQGYDRDPRGSRASRY